MRPPIAFGISRRRVVYNIRIGLGQVQASQVPAAHGQGRYGRKSSGELTLTGSFHVGEIEQLVLLDRAAHAAPELVEDVLRIPSVKEIRPRFDSIVVMVFVNVAVELVGPALDLDVDRRAPRQPLLRIKAVGRYVHNLNGVGRRDVGDVLRHPDVVLAHAVNAHIVAVAAGAVHVELKRARRVRRHGVGADRRVEAGHRPEQLFEIVPRRHGHIFDGRRRQVVVDVGGLSLQQVSGGVDFDGLGHGAELQDGVHPLHAINVDRDAGFLERPKSRRRNLDVVGASR